MSNEEKILEMLSRLQDDIALMRSEQKENSRTIAMIQIRLEQARDELKIIKEDVRDIKRQVNILYDWVDSLDLSVKDLKERTAR